MILKFYLFYLKAINLTIIFVKQFVEQNVSMFKVSNNLKYQ